MLPLTTAMARDFRSLGNGRQSKVVGLMDLMHRRFVAGHFTNMSPVLDRLALTLHSLVKSNLSFQHRCTADFIIQGSGVFLYFIVPVSKADGDYTQFKFSLDGNEGWAAAYNSNLRPASEGVDYNLLVFQAPFTNIGDHRLVVSLVARQEDPSYRQNHLLFDYVVYRSVIVTCCLLLTDANWTI